jgi:hypothetical protein
MARRPEIFGTCNFSEECFSALTFCRCNMLLREVYIFGVGTKFQIFCCPYWPSRILPVFSDFSLFGPLKLIPAQEDVHVKKKASYFDLRTLLPIQIQLLEIENKKIAYL